MSLILPQTCLRWQRCDVLVFLNMWMLHIWVHCVNVKNIAKHAFYSSRFVRRWLHVFHNLIWKKEKAMCLASATHAATIRLIIQNRYWDRGTPSCKRVTSQVTANLLLLKHQYGLGHRICQHRSKRREECEMHNWYREEMCSPFVLTSTFFVVKNIFFFLSWFNMKRHIYHYLKPFSTCNIQ